MPSPSPPCPPLHAVLIPIPSQSHVIPMSSLSLLLARRGLIVTVLLTPSSAVRSQSLFSAHPIHIRLLPSPDLGSGSGSESLQSLDSLPSPELRSRFLLACNSLLDPARSILRSLHPNPTFLVSSFLWTSDLAAELSIPRFNFGTVSCFTLFVTHQIRAHDLIATVSSDSDPFLVPDLPHRVEFTAAQLPLMLRRSATDSGRNVRDQFGRSLDCSDGVLMNTFEALEPDYCRLYRGIKDSVFCIGPLSKESDDDERHSCLEWLDGVEEPGSVVYVCFGTMAEMSLRQLSEVGLGLMGSGRKFVWVVKAGEFGEGLDFEGRGVVVRGWAPQVAILSHVAVGGFVTHCGWNSVLEGVCAGVPMVTWPMFAEQFYNEKLVVDVMRVGVRVGVEVSSEGPGGGRGVFVGREAVRRAVEELMGGGEEGGERRRRACEIGAAAKVAVEEGGSSELNMTAFIEHVRKLRGGR